jgi:hypothetical protein
VVYALGVQHVERLRLVEVDGLLERRGPDLGVELSCATKSRRSSLPPGPHSRPLGPGARRGGGYVPSLATPPVDEPAGEAGPIDLPAVSVNGLLAPDVFDGAVDAHGVREGPVRELLGTSEQSGRPFTNTTARPPYGSPPKKLSWSRQSPDS